MILAFKKLRPPKGLATHNTKLKHYNRNHRSSMGLETPRVDGPSWGVCYGAILKLGHIANQPFDFTRFSKIPYARLGLCVMKPWNKLSKPKADIHS